MHHLTPFNSFIAAPGGNGRAKLANVLENLITLCPSCHRRAEQARGARSSLSGLAYLLRHLAPLHLLCAPGDLGTAVQARASQTGLPRVTFYDRAPGGTGLSTRLYELFEDLLHAALERVRACPCLDGCPSCVGPTGEQDPGTKQLTERLLEVVTA